MNSKFGAGLGRSAMVALGLGLIAGGAWGLLRLRQHVEDAPEIADVAVPAEAQKLFEESEAALEKGDNEAARKHLDELDKRFAQTPMDFNDLYGNFGDYVKHQRTRLACRASHSRNDFANLAQAKEGLLKILLKRDAKALEKLVDCETWIGATESEFDVPYSPQGIVAELFDAASKPALVRRHPEALQISGLKDGLEHAFVFTRGDNGRWWLRYVLYGGPEQIESALTEQGWNQGGSL